MPGSNRTYPSASASNERRAAAISLVVGIVLMVAKFSGYLVTGSTAIFSDALESIVNVLASGFALYAIILAHQPADREHPYGHGKIEFLAAGFEGGMIVLASLLIVVQTVASIYRGLVIESPDIGLALVGVAMIVNGATGMFLIRSGRAHGSITLEADGRHLISDAISSAAVIAALGIYRFTGWKWIDPIAAGFVAVYIAWIGCGLLRRSAAGLMDEQDIDDERLIRGILDSHLAPGGKPPLICSYHKLRHRHSGRYHWVDFHLVVPADLDVERGHQIASAIEHEIEQALEQGNATAHVEPCKARECQVCAAKPAG